MKTIAKTWKTVAAELLTDARVGGASIALDSRAPEVERLSEALAKAYAQGAERALAAELGKSLKGRLDLIAREIDRARKSILDFELYSSSSNDVPLETVARDGAALVSSLATDDAASAFSQLRELGDRALQLERELDRSREVHEQTKEELRKTAVMLNEANTTAAMNAEAYSSLRAEWIAREPLVGAARRFGALNRKIKEEGAKLRPGADVDVDRAFVELVRQKEEALGQLVTLANEEEAKTKVAS